MILNIHFSSHVEERGPWVRALLLAVLVHAGALLVGYSLVGAAPKAAPPEEPELVFFHFAPPPPPAAGGAAKPVAVFEHMPRHARTRIPRPNPVHPAPVTELVREQPQVMPPDAAERLEAEPETPGEAPTSEEASGAAEGPAGVSGVVAGLVGGVLGGREGGLVGASGGTALELKQVARPPAVFYQVQPHYPRRARSEGIEGLVLVRVIIGTDGHVEPESPRILQSVPALDAAAVSAVSQWRFTPALGKQGRPVRVILEVPVQFSLK